MGDYSRPIATSNPNAQKFFDQGLALMYGFNHEEAARSFEKAASFDPKAVMPLWGLALVLGANYNDPGDTDRDKLAHETIAKALALALSAPAMERDYVEALAKRYSSDPKADRRQLAVAYKDAMGALMRKYPDDLDAATLYAESLMDLNPWRLWDGNGKPAEGTEEIVATLESVLRRSPAHPGANHYYIHAVEASKKPERALASAERLKTLVPGAGHLVHMPGHIYLRTGDFESAAKSNEVAAAADRAMIQATGANGMYPVMYYSHNLHFIAYSRSEQGRYPDAIQAARQIAANVKPALETMPMAQAFAAVPYLVMIRAQRWDEVLAAPDPGAKTGLLKAFWRFARGLAYAGKREVAKARQEAEAFTALTRQVPADTPYGNNTAAGVFAVAQASLDARIAETAGDRAAAITAWRSAVRAEDALVYDEPPPWYYPVRESLGVVLFRAGNHAEAEAVFRECLERTPRSPRSLFGLTEALKAQGKTVAAGQVRRQFEPLWKGATVKLSMDTM